MSGSERAGGFSSIIKDLPFGLTHCGVKRKKGDIEKGVGDGVRGEGLARRAQGKSQWRWGRRIYRRELAHIGEGLEARTLKRHRSETWLVRYTIQIL